MSDHKNEEREYFNKRNPNINYGIKYFEMLLDKVTEEILINNSKKGIEVPINKSKRFIQSQVYDTPNALKRPENKLLQYMKKWKEGIIKLIDSSYELVIFLLEKNLKSIKYTNNDNLFNNDLVIEIEKISSKIDHSKELNVNFVLKQGFNNDIC